MIEVGKFVITGDWDNTPTPNGKLRIVMPPPGRVSGCGWENFTQKALLALPQFISPGCSFCDVGAGTGILTVAAHLLGAHEFFCCEINPDALKVLDTTLKANGVAASVVPASLPPRKVDVMVVSIGDEFIKKYTSQLITLAKQVVVVTDEFEIKILGASG